MPSPAEITLQSDALLLRCTPAQGFSIASLVDRISGAEAFWQRPGHTPASCSRVLGPAGEASSETFVDLFAGGWFEMFPEVGYTQPGDPASLVHGEVVRLPWEVVSTDAEHVEARVACVRRPLTLTRRLTLDGARLHVAERIENVGAAPAPYTWGHHPCFSRTTFAGGRIELEAAAATVPEPWFQPESATLAFGDFDWPHAPARETSAAAHPGGAGPAPVATTPAHGAAPPAATFDLSQLPVRADGRHDHACLTMGSGSFRLIAPDAGPAGRALRIDFDRERFPYALLWQNFGAGDGFPFWGAADTFAIEFSTMPGRSTPDALAAGAVSQLHPGEVVETSFTVGWEAV
ncbi:hypothetical protein VSS74_04500 [Conexibacter stalactiti]|uniref:Aldose 1-epimerase n=1 Tax=Conexibacter stalactiti TaxID=1940611 RepID=A0ABU4HJT2_9ACTN|nr:hypothetical protein [Conexibacter stalactiti]MDW5593583.1 hypothetical protein [Conexibacter stalactiti]MEC5034224.1 hypothetical protein [Conexibacter stalactiti]